VCTYSTEKTGKGPGGLRHAPGPTLLIVERTLRLEPDWSALWPDLFPSHIRLYHVMIEPYQAVVLI
jgi:hypothetical protein